CCTLRSFASLLTRKILDGSENGRPRRKRSLIKLKMAVFAPIPSASVSAAMAVNAGCLRRIRSAYRRSCNMQLRPQLRLTAIFGFAIVRGDAWCMHHQRLRRGTDDRCHCTENKEGVDERLSNRAPSVFQLRRQD